MKAYWDSSALIETTQKPDLLARLKREGAFTRTHSLAETFAVLSGNPNVRFSAHFAAETVKGLAQYLDFVDVSADEVIAALGMAQAKGVRGGRVHDYIHALAAKKSGADTLLTLDKNDFTGLFPAVSVEPL